MKLKRMICSIGIVGLVFGLVNITMAGEDPKMGSGGKERGSIQTTLPAPKVINQTSFPVAVKAGDYDLVTIVFDFLPGSGFLPHFHGGYVLATVLEGEITLQEKGAERKVKTGESWTENAGDVHAVINQGPENTRVVVVVLLPKGAAATTFSGSSR